MRRRKVGTVMALNTPDFGEIYVAEGGAITADIGHAKVYRAPKKVLETIAAQHKVTFAPFRAQVTTIEKWEEQ